MNQRYLDYAHYTIWANDRLIADLSQMDESLLTKSVISSFSSIVDTVKHIWFGEEGWLSRLQSGEWSTPKVDAFSSSATVLFAEWQSTTRAFADFVEIADLEQPVQFTHDGQQYAIPAREVVQTVFNHGSYHRGQVVTLMRQLGVTRVTKTDYIEWVRERARG